MSDSLKLAQKAQALQANSMLKLEFNLQACWLYANRNVLSFVSLSTRLPRASKWICSWVGVMGQKLEKLDPNIRGASRTNRRDPQ